MNNILDLIKKNNILIFVFLGFLVYFPSLFYDFVYDDNTLLLPNQYINGRVAINFFDFFVPKLVMDAIYTPLTFIIYWSIIKIFGISSFAFHFVNVVFYIVSSIALYYLLKKIINNDLVSLFAVILYIIHPCHIENTAWISAMGYNIAVFFFFLSFLYFIIAFDENKKLNYIYSVIFYVLAILSQPIAVTLPVIIFLWIYCFRKEKFKESIVPILSYFPFLFIYLFLYHQTILKIYRFDIVKLGFLDKFSILGFDIFNSFFPINLCPLHPLPSFFFIIYFIIYFIILYFFRNNKIFVFFCLVSIVTIFPYSNIFFDIIVPLADRYLLLFSVSSCVFLSIFSFWLLEKFRKRIFLKYIAFVFLIVLYLLSFILYLPVWKNNRNLWIYTYNVNPDNIVVLSTISDLCIKDKEYDKALMLSDLIIEKYPKSFEGYELKIRILMLQDSLNEAKDVCIQLLKIIPDYYKTYLYLCDIYIAIQNYKKAEDILLVADKIAEKYDLLKNERVYLFLKRKMILAYINAEPEKFIEYFRVISNDFKLLQDNVKFFNILEQTDYNIREEICLNFIKKYNTNYSQSVIQFLSCLYMKEKYKENASEVMKSLLKDMEKAQQLINKGDNGSAEKIYLSVIDKNRYMYQAYYNLGILYLQTNEQKKAKEIFSKMLDINPNDEQIKQLLNTLRI